MTRMLVLGAVLLGIAGFFFFYRDHISDVFILGLLGILSMIGVFYLFASVIGLVRVAGQPEDDGFGRAFLDTHGEGTVFTDSHGRPHYANRAYADMTGAREATEVQSLEAVLSQYEEAADAVYRLANAAARNGSAVEEFRLMRGLGGKAHSPRWYRARIRRLTLPESRESLLCWQIADISDERGDQEQFFRDVQKAIDHLDRAPVGFFSTDLSGRVTYVNATLSDWLGLDFAALVPGSIALSQIISGEGMAFLESVRAEPGATRTAAFDLDMLRTDRRRFAARLIHRVQSNPDGTPGPSRTIVLSRSDAAGADEMSGDSGLRFTRFFNSTPMAIAAVDRDGRILHTNPRFLSTFASVIDRDAVERKARIETVVHERDREKLARAIADAAQNRAEIEPFDSIVPGSDDRHVRFFVNAATQDGETVDRSSEVALIYAVDTTEQKALEAQMAQSQKMQAVGQLAGGIAHDFNNVLTAIIISSDLLLNNHRSADPSFQDIMNIKQNANRAASLVRQLLAFSRRQTLRPEILSLIDVLADLRMLLSRLIGNSIELHIDHGRDLWPVKVDLGQFEQVIVNLAVNARDAMPNGGQLTISTRNVTEGECKSFGFRGFEPGEYVLIDVADTGAGIAPDVLEKIFEPFFTTKEVGKGTGLGLSMVYGIIKQTGGFIYATSTPGAGATFHIFLPRHIVVEGADAGRPSSAPEPERKKDLSGSATVLLVEDEDAVRMGGVRSLQSRGYTVLEAASGVEALEIMEERGGEVDIVVSDVVMPEMDGPTLLRELRKTRPDMKFIFVSGYAEDAFAKNLPEGSKFGFLPKPFSLKQLATAVKDMLEGDSAG